MTDLSNTGDFASIAKLIRERRIRAARLINHELVDLYWELGKEIHHRVSKEDWGRGTVAELAAFLNTHTPGLRGFSASNLWRMRQFYETWQEAPTKLATLLRELPAKMYVACKEARETYYWLRLLITTRLVNQSAF